MKKKDGFIAISLLYSFLLCFIVLMMALLADYVQATLVLNKLNEPLVYEDNKLYNKLLLNNEIYYVSQLSKTNILLGTGSEGLYITEDDDSTTYVFRGANVNNHVIFAGLNWRIVRINGDGTIRLILDEAAQGYDLDNLTADKQDITSAFNDYDSLAQAYQYVQYTISSTCKKSNPCVSQFNSETNTFEESGYIGDDSKIKTALENWYKQVLATYNDQIAVSGFCNDTNFETSDDVSKYYYYGRYRIMEYSPSLICNGESYYKLSVGLITADEVILSGASTSTIATSEVVTPSDQITSYLYNSDEFYTLTPFLTEKDTDSAYMVTFGSTSQTSEISTNEVTTDLQIRPVINLISTITVSSGDGTSADPYVIY